MNISRQVYIVVVVLSFMLVIPPLLCVIAILLYSWLKNNKETHLVDIIALCLLMFFIQSTRLDKDSDWQTYMSLFSDASNISFKYYLELYNQSDYCWYALTYVLNRICMGNEKFYGEIIICSIYAFAFGGIYKYWKTTSTPYRYCLAGFIMLGFFYQYLGNSNNLLRQQFATSVIIFSLIMHYCEGKRTWPLMIFAVLCHTMVLAFVPLYWLTSKTKPRLKTIVIISIAVLCASFIISHLSVFSFLNGLYVYDRLSSGMLHDDDNNVINVVVIIPYAITMLFFFYKSIFKNYIVLSSTLYVQYISIYIVLLCILLVGMPLIVTRFYITRMIILPYIIPYLLNPNNKLSELYLAGIAMAFMVMFFNSTVGYFDISFLEHIITPGFMYDVF